MARRIRAGISDSATGRNRHAKVSARDCQKPNPRDKGAGVNDIPGRKLRLTVA